MSDDDRLIRAEVVDRVVYDDGWSVQIDKELFESGRMRYCIYVFPDQEDSESWELEVGSLHEALQQMHSFFKRLHDEEEDEDAHP